MKKGKKIDIEKLLWKICTWIVIFPLSCLSRCINSIIDEYNDSKEAIEGAEEEIDFMLNT